MFELLLAQAVTTDPTPTGLLFQSLYTVIAAAVAAAALGIAYYFATAAAGSKKMQVLAQLWETAQNVVAHVEVHMRPEITAALADGKLSPVEAAALKARALALLKEAAGPQLLQSAQKILRLTAPALEVFLSGFIERALGVQRAAGTLPPPAPSAVRQPLAAGTPARP